MKNSLQRQWPPQSLVGWLPGAHVTAEEVQVLTAKEMQRQYGTFFESSPGPGSTVVAAFDDAMDEWLGVPEADAQEPSDEYVAYSAMRMAAYHL